MSTVLDDLNSFYLGKTDSGAYHLLPSKLLTTHGFCVGMTGSGKTGFCLNLLEEAAIDGIPALIVDFKGDLSNHFLQFPNLKPEDFRPWMDPSLSEADAQAQAEQAASRWREGLENSEIDSARIQKLCDSVEFALYTPGSTLGRSLSITNLFACPDSALMQEIETAQTLITSRVTALLQLIEEDTDPLTSKPLILLTNLIGRAWTQGNSLSLTQLIDQILHPPIERLGVMALEDFYPAKERNQLALKLNTLFASPSFSAWMQGEPLELEHLLFNERGKPKHTVLHLAHLSEADRMFFVTLLLNTLISWMRTQGGASSLRALLFIDELFGYLPPVENPPSKKPLLTLLKQARAYGIGLLLASQNPVDLDYRALTNCGLWWIGRLSTAQDQARLLDALSQQKSDNGLSAEGLSALQPREFWQRSPDSSTPVRFSSRFCMGYLPGPLQANQLRTLAQQLEEQTANRSQTGAAPTGLNPEAGTPKTSEAPETTGGAADAAFASLALDWAQATSPAPTASENLTSTHTNTSQESPLSQPETDAPSNLRPILDERIPVAFAHSQQTQEAHYRPSLFGQFQIQYQDRKAGLQTTQICAFQVPLDSSLLSWDPDQLIESDYTPQTLALAPLPNAQYDILPPAAKKTTSYTRWTRQLQDSIAQRTSLTLFYAPQTKQYSTEGETEAQFVARLRLQSRETLDKQMESLQSRYEKELARLNERIRKAKQSLEREQQESGQKQRDAWISIGSTILSGLLGGGMSRTTSKISTATRGINRIAKQKGDVSRAEETVSELERQYEERLQACEQEIHSLREQLDQAYTQIQPVTLTPKRTQISPLWVGLLWEAN